MQSEAKVSTEQRSLRRRRRRYFASEALQLRVVDLTVLLAGERDSLRVRWPALDRAMTIERLGENELLVSGSAGETAVSLSTVRRGAHGLRRLFACPGCRRTCTEVFLPPGESSFACRRCRRIRYHERAGPSPISRLQDEWARLGQLIDELRLVQTRGQRPEVGGVEVDVRALRRELRDLQRRVEAAAPPQAG